jgi:hypothetical protein
MLTLLEFPIGQLSDFLRLATYINAYRYEEDPKELKDGAYHRQGMGWDTKTDTDFCRWKRAVSQCTFDKTRKNQRVDKYDIFVDQSTLVYSSNRISYPKLAAYILAEKLTEVVNFIQHSTPDVFEALMELSKFLNYFRMPIAKAAQSSNHLYSILTAIHLERGATWANQLRWFLEDEDNYKHKRSQIQRSFVNRWGDWV